MGDNPKESVVVLVKSEKKSSKVREKPPEGRVV